MQHIAFIPALNIGYSGTQGRVAPDRGCPVTLSALADKRSTADVYWVLQRTVAFIVSISFQELGCFLYCQKFRIVVDVTDDFLIGNCIDMHLVMSIHGVTHIAGVGIIPFHNKQGCVRSSEDIVLKNLFAVNIVQTYVLTYGLCVDYVLLK